MDSQKPPSYDASVGIEPGFSNPNYRQEEIQSAPPTQGYLPQQLLPQQEPPPPQYSYPPIIHPPNNHAAPLPSYEESEKNRIHAADVEANLPAVRGIVGFNDKSIRLGFIRKVFAIVMLQMVVTIGMTALFMFHEPTKQYVQQSRGTYIGAYVTFVVLYFVLVCCTNVARRFPVNLILLAVFTFSIGYLVAAISTYHDTKIVLAAFGMTTLCTLCVCVFASQTKYDITKCSGVLFCLLVSLFVFGIFAAVLVPYGYMRILNVVYAGLGALLFMGFLAYDIQTLMGGKKYSLNPDDYVYAALQLYIDVIYIFLFILQLFSAGK